MLPKEELDLDIRGLLADVSASDWDEDDEGKPPDGDDDMGNDVEFP